MQEITALSPRSESWNITPQTKNILPEIKSTLQQTGFSVFEETTIPDDFLYATTGKGHPHVLFIAETAVIHDSSLQNSAKSNTAQTALNCFINACRQHLGEGGNSGKISIVISSGYNADKRVELNQIFKRIGLLSQDVDFCIIGEPRRGKKSGQEINIGSLGNILLTLTSFGTSSHCGETSSQQINAVQNLLNLLYKLKNNLLDGGNEIFSSSTISILQLKTAPAKSLHLPDKASATIHVRYNNTHTPQDIVGWMQNLINFTGGQFELKSEIISKPYISDINAGTDALKKSISDFIPNTLRYSTNCTSSFSDIIKDYCPFAEFGPADDTDLLPDTGCLRSIYYRFLHRYLNGGN